MLIIVSFFSFSHYDNWNEIKIASETNVKKKVSSASHNSPLISVLRLYACIFAVQISQHTKPQWADQLNIKVSKWFFHCGVCGGFHQMLLTLNSFIVDL